MTGRYSNSSTPGNGGGATVEPMEGMTSHHTRIPSLQSGRRFGFRSFRLLLLPATCGVMAWAATNGSPAAAVLRDIKGPVAIESPRAWLWRLLFILAVGALVALAWWVWHRRRTPESAQKWIPSPDERALARLQAALDRIGEPERFVTEVSEIARTYLEERFGLHAPDRTTEEFLIELSDSSALDTRHKSLLADFLTRCDLVKFARAEADRSELTDLHAAALHLVEETKPSKASSPGTGTPSPAGARP